VPVAGATLAGRAIQSYAIACDVPNVDAVGRARTLKLAIGSLGSSGWRSANTIEFEVTAPMLSPCGVVTSLGDTGVVPFVSDANMTVLGFARRSAFVAGGRAVSL
jgi:hypothetical protein